MTTPDRRLEGGAQPLSHLSIRDVKIKTKLVFLVGLLIAAIALLTYWYFPHLYEHERLRAVAEHGETIGHTAALRLASVLDTGDREALQEFIDALREHRELTYCVVVDGKDSVLGSYNMALAERARYAEVDQGGPITPDGTIYRDVTDIAIHDRTAGRLFIGLSLHSVHEEVSRTRSAIALASCVIFVVGTLVVLMISRLVSAPLVTMMKATAQITNGDLSCRAEVNSRDEVGVLAGTFNQMVDRLAFAQQQLAEANRSLEQRVQARTRELREEVNERIKVETMFRQQAQALASSMDGMAVLDGNERYTFLNDAHAAIYGYDSPTELLGRSWTTLYGEDEVERFRQVIMPKLYQAGHWSGEAVGRRRDGSTFPQELSLNRLDGRGLVCVVRDITERKNVEKRVRFQASLLDQVNNGAAATTLDGILTYWNRHAEALHGWTSEEVIGQQALTLLFSPQARGRVLRLLKLPHFDGQPRQVEVPLKRKDGSEFQGYVSLAPIEDEAGVPMGYVGICLDLTNLKRTEREVKLLAQTLTSTKDCISVTDLDNNLLYVNDAFIEKYGYRRDELLGKNISLVLGHSMMQGMNRDILEATMAGGWYGEVVNRRKDGSEFPLELWTSVVHDDSGKPMALVGVARDITERKKTEQSLMLFRALINQSGEAIEVVDPESGRFVDANDAAWQSLGYGREEFLSKTIFDIDPSIDRAQYPAMLHQLRTSGSISIEGVHRRKDGSTFPVEVSLRYVVVEREYILSIARDITERKSAEEAIRASEERYRLLSESALTGVYLIQDGVFGYVNPTFASIFGYAVDEIIGKLGPMDLTQEEDRPLVAENIHKRLDGTPNAIQYRFRATRKDGTTIDVEVHGGRTTFRGTPAIIGTLVDVSERKQAEERLKLAEEKYRGIFENAVVGIYQSSIDGQCLTVNPTFAHMCGYDTPDEFLSCCRDFGHDFYVKSGRRAEFIALMMQRGTLTGFESQVYRKDRSVIWISENARILRDTHGVIIGFEGTTVDITERKRAEEATSKLLRAVEQTNDVVFMTEINGTITYVNPAFEKLYGFTREEAVGKTPRILKSGKYGYEFYESFWRELFSGRGYRGEQINRTKSGAEVAVEVAVSPVFANENILMGFIAVQRDITARRQQDHERKVLEAQLAQAQKIEALGTLAGGIAHDFNNILGIILGHVSLIETTPDDEKRRAASLASITAAVDRGAGLVRQILTFARKTDVVMEDVRVSDAVSELVKMLRETFPKTITFVTKITTEEAIIEGDKTQLHQTLLNLCVNARDAMESGGSILITVDVLSGAVTRRTFPMAQGERYVKIEVADDGSGMSAETVQHIFEPFFTTKETGKGTGLGLAVVYGIVKGHGGFIGVQSEPGKGTMFSLYFPAAMKLVDAACDGARETMPVIGGHETILVVEDEEMLRDFVQSLLISHGYTVLCAGDGEQALKVVGEHIDEVDLVLTDMGLPKLNGRDLMERFKDIGADVKTIVASGFLDPQVKVALISAGAKAIVQKPYVADDLLRRIREVLETA